MKDHVQIGHLTKYDAFRMNREYGSKSIQTSLILTQCPPKSYKLLKYFMIFVILFKMSKHSDFNIIFFQTEGARFYSCHKTNKKLCNYVPQPMWNCHESCANMRVIQSSPNRCHLDLNDSAPSLNEVSRNKK